MLQQINISNLKTYYSNIHLFKALIQSSTI